MKKKVLLAVVSLFLLGYTAETFFFVPVSKAQVQQEQDWKKEFADVCAGTQNAWKGRRFAAQAASVARMTPQQQVAFAEVCAGTQNAMLLSVEELQALVKRCAALEERLDELNGQEGKTERKVYTKRLKMCRDLYQFTLDYMKRQE